MTQLNLVTGANGHLGNNLIRDLLQNGEKVRGSARNLQNLEPFEGLDVELVNADLLDKAMLVKALEGVHTLYHCAAVFKHWAKDPEKEILMVNREGTRYVLEAAAEQKVKKVVFVSSIVALDYRLPPMNESTWNTNFSNPYNQSKTESEKLAWQLAKEFDLNMVTVLPAALVGPHHSDHLTPTMKFLNSIINKQVMVDTCFNFNFIDVKDVTKGMVAAAKKGRSGQRYILGSKEFISTTQTFEIAKSIVPDFEIPPKISKKDLREFAVEMEKQSKATGEAPLLTAANVDMYYEVDVRLDISKAGKELDFHPRDPEIAVKETLQYLFDRNKG